MSTTTRADGGNTSSEEDDETTQSSCSSSASCTEASTTDPYPKTLTPAMKDLMEELETCTRLLQSHRTRSFRRGRTPRADDQNIDSHRTGLSCVGGRGSTARTSSIFLQIPPRDRPEAVSSSSFDNGSLTTVQPESTAHGSQRTPRIKTPHSRRREMRKSAAEYKRKLDELLLRESRSRSELKQNTARIVAATSPYDKIKSFFRDMGQSFAKELPTTSPKQIFAPPKRIASNRQQEPNPKNYVHRLTAGALPKNAAVIKQPFGRAQPSAADSLTSLARAPHPRRPGKSVGKTALKGTRTFKGLVTSNQSRICSEYPSAAKPEKQTTHRLSGGAEIQSPRKLSPRVLELQQPPRNFPERLRSRLALSRNKSNIIVPNKSSAESLVKKDVSSNAIKNEQVDVQKAQPTVPQSLFVPFARPKNVYMPKFLRNHLHENHSTSPLENTRTHFKNLLNEVKASTVELFGPVLPLNSRKQIPEYQVIRQQLGYTENVKAKDASAFPIECVLQVHVPFELHNDGVRISITEKKIEVSSCHYHLNLRLLFTADTSNCKMKYLVGQKKVEIILRVYEE